jgi:membrane-bound metal-dependent hydrolase YbcI (DUF457 family)
LALCVLAGMIYNRYADHNPVWLIWFAMFIPDSDYVVQLIWESVFPTKITPVIHGGFHNILTLVIASYLFGWYIWKNTKIRFTAAAFCVALGFTVHLVEDALVNGIVYHFYIPISSRGWYQGYILTPMDDIIFANTVIASTNIIVIGILLLILTIMIRSNIQGYDWLEKYNPVPFINRTIKNRFSSNALRASAILGVTTESANEEDAP